jgi:acetyl esterase/lipase
MKQSIIFSICVFLLLRLPAQPWVDTLYAIQSTTGLPYGEASDFAGNLRSLALDISWPVNDSPPACGRPLILLVHGGAFIAGSNTDFFPARLRQDFAKRGYVAAALSYRLGMFQTSLNIHCNVSSLGAEWDCLNMADTTEWYRAYFRGVQDVKGAIRFLVNHAADYGLDPQNIFVAGESAGGFLAMGAAFIDDPSEDRPDQTGALPSLPAPNAIYQAPCVQGYGLDTSIASLDLARPSLGSYEGSLNLPAAKPYRIAGVGSFFGGALYSIFSAGAQAPPALYLFHQPSDLVVPYRSGKVFAGYNLCATQFPFNCQNIINRPFIIGSKGIQERIESLLDSQLTAPVYLFDSTTNTASCAAQLLNPSLQGHAIDNFGLRTQRMAAFFADQISICALSAAPASPAPFFSVFPNPLNGHGALRVKGPLEAGSRLIMSDLQGKVLAWEQLAAPAAEAGLRWDMPLPPGLYVLSIRSGARAWHMKVELRP